MNKGHPKGLPFIHYSGVQEFWNVGVQTEPTTIKKVILRLPFYSYSGVLEYRSADNSLSSSSLGNLFIVISIV